MQLFADKNAKPVAFHKAFHIPMHWQAAVKKQLDNDVPLGTPTEWCSRMVVVAKKDPTKPRRTVDFQNLNKVCARQTHAGKSPFHRPCQCLLIPGRRVLMPRMDTTASLSTRMTSPSLPL